MPWLWRPEEARIFTTAAIELVESTASSNGVGPRAGREHIPACLSEYPVVPVAGEHDVGSAARVDDVAAAPTRDHGTNEVRRFARTDQGAWIGTGFVGIESDLVAAEGAAWVTTTDGRLLRIDPNHPGATRVTRSRTGELDGFDGWVLARPARCSRSDRRTRRRSAGTRPS